ncbi:hypothetical protein LTR84_013000 [Exophiala bonariae]|uniref:RNB domain-containing protein n=1 Tax=Exophiala bonariae TaxID=1690606 RepID=A0AAV9NDP2_9EURO|nr:hypothetical protein LTR84_013000 [Exophiala bonariae]
MTTSSLPAPFLKTLSRQFPYVCPRCRLRARLSGSSKSSKPSFKYTTTTTTRQFVTSRPCRSIEPSLNSPPPPSPPPPLSSIRSHLKSWTIHNKDQKARAAEDIYSGSVSKRLTTLPNSLFQENSRVDDEDSEDYSNQDPDTIEGDTAGLLRFIKPGALLFGQNSVIGMRAQFAVYLGQEGYQSQFLLADGRYLVDTSFTHACPIIKDFATAEEVRDVRQHLPKHQLVKQSTVMPFELPRTWAGELPRSSSDPLLRRIASLVDDISSYRRDNITLLDSVIDKISHPQHYQKLDWHDVVHKVMACDSSDLSPVATMAIFFALTKQPTHVQILRGSPRTGTLWFIVVPKRSATRFQSVRDWGRDYQEAAARAALGKDVKDALDRNPLTSFIDKARRIILKSRKIRSPTTTGHLGPSMVPVTDQHATYVDTGETFSDNDQMIIEFLWDTCIRTPVDNRYRTIYNSVASIIIRAIGAYPKLRLERKIGRLLMQELGVITPWADAFDHDVEYPMPGVPGSHDLVRLYEDAQASCEAAWPLGSHPKYQPELDSMASLRRNFDLPALCVDSVDTSMRDDAYSLEPNPTIPGTYWIHAHISHVSAFITPDHPAAQLASQVLETSYTATRVMMMLPQTVAQALSLGAGSPAMTISTLLNEEGEVLDIKIQPTLLKNVVILDSSAVHMTMEDKVSNYATFELGDITDGNLSKASKKPTQAALDAARTHHETLKQIDRLMRKRIATREKLVTEIPDWPFQQHKVEVRSNVKPHFPIDQGGHSRHILEEPAIYTFATPSVQIIRQRDSNEQQDVTARVMSLASESAGKWFADRSIPAIYRCAIPDPDFPISKLNKLDLDTKRILPHTFYSSTPQPHASTNIDTYLRFTSPLRRYTDLLAHWQADAYIRAESKAGPNSAPIDQLPFSHELIEREVVRLMDWSKVILKKSRQQRTYWQLRALFRAFHFKEAQLPKRWDMMVRNVSAKAKQGEDDTLIRGMLLPFGYETVLLESRKKWEADASVNCYLPVQIELVDLSASVVHCRAIGPPRETPFYKKPLRIVSRSADLENATGH